jgi:hypothetical protein
MTTVQTLCHRAMLLHDGELRYIGAPEDAALSYYRMNFASAVEAQLPAAPGERARLIDVNARVVGATLGGASGEPVETLAEGEPIVLDVVLEAARALSRPVFTFHFRNDKGQTVFELMRRLDAEVAPGRRIALAGPVENRLVPGRYSLDLYVGEHVEADTVTVQGLRLLHFVVTGTTESHGLVTVTADVEPVLRDAAE